MKSPLTRTVQFEGPYALGSTVRVLRHGAGDPTCRVEGSVWWFGQATANGPATVRLEPRPGESSVEVTAWGAGAAWAVEAAADLLGAGDDATGYVPHHDLARAGQRLMAGWRITRSRLVTQSLVPAIIEQKVTGKEAFASHRRLVHEFGAPAPGPGEALGLRVPPAPREWARIPSWAWLRAGVDGKRSGTSVRASMAAGRLEQCSELTLVQARQRLAALPGVGEWTVAEVVQRALGDPDSPSFGDYHLAPNLTWALTGAVGDDDLARELLAPYAGHRYRAACHILAAAGQRPRRGARRSLPTHLPIRFR